jgi:hypothetical protein
MNAAATAASSAARAARVKWMMGMTYLDARRLKNVPAPASVNHSARRRPLASRNRPVMASGGTRGIFLALLAVKKLKNACVPQ